MHNKFIIYNSDYYKEIPVSEDSFRRLSIGTGKDCHALLAREDFLTDFRLLIEKHTDDYVAICSDGITILTDDHVNEQLCRFHPGESIRLCYASSDVPFLNIDFTVDFHGAQKNYNISFDLHGASVFSMGSSPDNMIQIPKSHFVPDQITFTRNADNTYTCTTQKLLPGISINGNYVKKVPFHLCPFDFLGVGGVLFYYDGQSLFTSDQSGISSQLPTSTVSVFRSPYQYPHFVRGVRQQYETSDDTIEVLPPKALPTKPKRNLLMILLPTVLMLFLMVFIRGYLGGGGYFVLYFAASMTISGAMSVWNYLNSGKEYRLSLKNREEKYSSYLISKEDAIQTARRNERTIFTKSYPSLETVTNNIEHYDAHLFERRKGQKDYLDIRIGTGVVESEEQIRFKKQEYVDTDDPFMDRPEQLHDKYRYIEDMPVVLHLKDLDAVGVVGTRTKLYQLAKNMILWLCGEYYHTEVKIILLMDESDVTDFSWARWLQHLADNDLNHRLFMYDQDSYKDLLGNLYAELSGRASLKKEVIDTMPDYIVFAYRSDRLNGHPITDYISHASALGFTFIFFEEREELLHSACNQRIFLDASENRGYIQDVLDGTKMQSFHYSHVRRETAASCASILAPVFIDEVNLENTLTKNITLYELLGIMNAYDLNLSKRWEDARVYESMAAPLGVKSGGDVLYLDLHERFHGPHGLVAGTTGAGKSELMQTFILSMASLFHPYEVGFILIDFKGGGMANQFRDLPHLNGAITNIDGKQIDRSLKSIRAELMKRQELFAKYDVNQIDNYIRLYRDGVAAEPLPHLILIVDEFAELKSDQPEFMKELISTARIGRSLGVHLILATQKPAGVVNDQIWSNSRFKLCLKVQDKTDSNEMLHSPLAAEIREPGRAYLQVGNNEIFELFQSAYSGAPSKINTTDNRRKFDLCEVNLFGKRTIVYHQEPSRKEGTETQLDALVSYIKEHCEQQGIAKLPDICLAPLPEMIPYPETLPEPTETDIIIPLGIYDDPSRQLQEELYMNFSQSHAFILGSSLSGKTCMIQSMIMGLTMRYTPDQVNLYLMDFASMILKSFEPLHHVGSVMTIAEDDKIKHFIELMQKKIEERRKVLSSVGLSSFSAYLESGQSDMPQIIVFLDNYTVFRSTYEEFEEPFLSICRDGVAVGISVVITNQQLSGIGFRLLTSFATKIAMHCNDRGQYSGLLDRCRTEPDDVPGRAVTTIDMSIMEFQAYFAFSMEREIDRINKIREYIDEKNRQYPDMRAESIVSMPEMVTDDYLLQRFGPDTDTSFRYLAGISYKTTQPEYLQMMSHVLIALSGRDDLGRADYLKYLLLNIMRKNTHVPVQLYVLDDANKTLAFTRDAEVTQYYATSVSESTDIIDRITDTVSSRSIDTGNAGDPFIIAVFHNQLAADVIRSNDDTYTKFQTLVTEHKNSGLCMLFSDFPNAPIGAASNPILRQLRDCGHILFFENLSAIQPVTIPIPAIRSVKKEAARGDAVFISDGSIKRIKTPLHME